MSTAVAQPRIDDCDLSKLAFWKQLEQLEVEGYVVLPDSLSLEQLEKLRRETAKLKIVAWDYSDKQQGCSGTNRNKIRNASPGLKAVVPRQGRFDPTLAGQEIEFGWRTSVRGLVSSLLGRYRRSQHRRLARRLL